MPIPFDEIEVDPNLTQNPGYKFSYSLRDFEELSQKISKNVKMIIYDLSKRAPLEKVLYWFNPL